MENIIEELAYIEKTAKGVAEKTEKDIKAYDKKLKNSKKEIECRVEKETKEKINAIKEKAFDEIQEKRSQIILDTQAKFSDIEVEFEENMQEWQEDLFNEIIGR